jgi:glycosyltransferase involved in cell wall biosynthesis
MADSIACDSFATRWDLERLFRGIGRKIKVLYPPINYGPLSGKTREKRFVVLDGGENKNTKTVLIAFQQFRENHPEYALAILGQRSIGHCNEEGVSFESMDRYQELLAGSCGLLFCSLHEGLGLPALEAMSFACPMVLSDIPALRETCDEAGCFVDPRDIGSIVAGMEECVLNNREWVKRSAQGALRYKNMSENAGKEWLEIYNRLV